MSSTPPPMYYLMLALMTDQMREMVSAMVAGFVADGFTEEQARHIVAGFFASMAKKQDATDD